MSSDTRMQPEAPQIWEADLVGVSDIADWISAVFAGRGPGGNSRSTAHRSGEMESLLNGRQPIFALLGWEDVRTLEGRLLTIADASFSDREQRKAFKDLIRNAIWFDWIPNLDTDDPSHGKPDLNR